MKNDIKKNDEFTEKTISTLFGEHGNIFYIRSTHATFSSVWYYSQNKLKLFKLAKGNIISQEEHTIEGIDAYGLLSKGDLYELDQCMELDGDIFGYKLKRPKGTDQHNFPINIDCLKKNRYKSDFLNKINKDINEFKIWNIKYE